jgi:hypothetical protein
LQLSYVFSEKVVLHGSFDDWTQGIHLAPDDSSPWTTWRARVPLLAGAYEIKMKVDGSWRPAEGFPLASDGLFANNLLVVT